MVTIDQLKEKNPDLFAIIEDTSKVEISTKKWNDRFL